MDRGLPDPREIPILTDAVERGGVRPPIDYKAAQSAILDETLKLAQTLLHQAVRDIEATLFERVLDRLRAELPELMARVMREYDPHWSRHGESPDR
jgi:hypothetical protein